MRILFVAEKPSISKSIAQILGGRPQQIGQPPRTPVTWRFEYPYNGQQCEIICTSVAGHIMEMDFANEFKKWDSCNPVELFRAPLVKSVKQTLESFAANIRNYGRTADLLVIWTDCDREGENIGAEIAEIARGVNGRIQVFRARFSVISQSELRRAMNQLDRLNLLTSAAVDARQELDLRIGAAFTRFMTKRLRVFSDLKDQLISYGPCQFPTLGFIVDRYRSRSQFTAEPFWKINLAIRKEGTSVKFGWQRVHLFDEGACLAFLEGCRQARYARVVKVDMKPKDRWKPLPLTTVELTKMGSRLLHMSSDRIMKVAEDLYNRGLLSYPRTETDQFEPSFNVFPLIEKQQNDPQWGAFAQSLLNGGFSTPRKGRNNDKAHPPIHPTAAASNLAGEEKKVFELVARRFLACCSQNAKGSETVVEVQMGEESFTARGLMILERNYLDVYPYDRWTDQDIPTFRQGEQLIPEVLDIDESSTQPPSLLTEADLITLMDKSGIGTDATIAQHIKTIQDRKYAVKDGNGRFSPTTLGFALIEGYDNMGFGYDISLSKPYLRSQTEADMKRIIDGDRTKDDVVANALLLYKDVFQKVITQSARLQEAVARHFGREADVANVQAVDLVPIKKCRCGRSMSLRAHANGKFVGCSGYPTCRAAMWISSSVVASMEALDRYCDTCSTPENPLALVQFRFMPGKVPAYIPLDYVACLTCDAEIEELLRAADFPQNRQTNGGNAGARTANPHGGAQNGHQPPNSRPFNGPSTGRPPPPPPTSRSSVDVAHDGDTKLCQCGDTAVTRTVKKEGPNMGRQFYCCGKPQNDPARCDFFEFMGGNDRPAPRSSNYAPPPSRGGASFSDRNNHQSRQDDQDDSPRCRCGLLASKKTVFKEGPNKGREFYTCARAGSQCGFFEWADGDNGNGNGESSYTTTNQSRGDGRGSWRGGGRARRRGGGRGRGRGRGRGGGGRGSRYSED
ncbi:prokaryotic type I DNA topoisomerase [Gonapodya prolifera JEL478]|uniref:DNA topoisomerase n=1 Tax=Gonapodya prolifera (strain JEL478) TaxID=1344416 RepID=A0A139APE3_GONPJ|nr:prokaryotic type I DNA topoisomerase [Gonapodya prolifera JEL478]|eukprot:KXS18631.1 prokaryotic type I DNA topoisomerase [Gonapodya prolifera JEL478]